MISWKKLFVKLSDLIIFVYLAVVFITFGNSSEGEMLCKGVDIEMCDGENEGFLDKAKIEGIMKKYDINPMSLQMKDISTYKIERTIRKSPYVSEVNCYKTHTGRVKIKIKQRVPAFMASLPDGRRYFMDKSGNIMPEYGTAPYVMVVTGNFNREFARKNLVPLVSYINKDNFWHNQIEQINVVQKGGIELIPRVGNHTVYLGSLPNGDSTEKHVAQINRFMEKKLTRLLKFYKYGLSKVGWNRYSYISVEFDNQIICKKKNKK